MQEKISIEGVIKMAIDSSLIDVHTSIPCIVEAVGVSTVDVLVAIKRVDSSGNGINVPVLPDVPVMFPGNSSVSIAHSISKGDEGLLIFCERDISSFVETGKELKPVDYRLHEYSDAVYIPFSMSNGKRVQVPVSGIEITGDVKINGSMSVSGEVTALSDGSSVTLSGHTHIDSQGGSTQPPTGGT